LHRNLKIKELLKKHLYTIGILFHTTLLLCQQQNTVDYQNWQWRGENRNGMYLNETGLLKEWAADGPKLLWHYDGLGEGHTSVAISNEKIYITGMHDDCLILYELDMTGKLLREKEVGKEWDTNWNGTRSSVCVNDEKLYIFSALGTLYCLNIKTFDEVWKKDILAEFDGKNLNFGMTENPLIVGEKIFLTPGGEKNNMIALNKHTGDLIWSSPGKGELSAYCSPLYIGGYSIPIVVTNTSEHIIAVNIDTGEMLWSHPHRNRPREHPNTPIYSDGVIFFTSGFRAGSVLLRLTNGGRNFEQVWKNEDLDNRMGGAVKIGDYVYASGHQNRGWFCIDWKTGETKYRSDKLANGAIIYADGMLYCYGENGEIALVKPNPENFEVVSSFKAKSGNEQHWAHPVIYNGILFIRHGDMLMAYDIKK